jgi:hypothetical protein
MTRRTTSPASTAASEQTEAPVREIEIQLVAETPLELNDEAAAVLARIIHAHLERERRLQQGAA